MLTPLLHSETGKRVKIQSIWTWLKLRYCWNVLSTVSEYVQVAETEKDAERDGITIPKTSEEYCVAGATRSQEEVLMEDEEFDYDDDYEDDDESNCPADYSFSSGIPR